MGFLLWARDTHLGLRSRIEVETGDMDVNNFTEEMFGEEIAENRSKEHKQFRCCGKAESLHNKEKQDRRETQTKKKKHSGGQSCSKSLTVMRFQVGWEYPFELATRKFLVRVLMKSTFSMEHECYSLKVSVTLIEVWLTVFLKLKLTLKENCIYPT